VLQLPSLRSQGRNVPETICCCGCHGNDVVYIGGFQLLPLVLLMH
jgi:hypothetical protein